MLKDKVIKLLDLKKLKGTKSYEGGFILSIRMTKEALESAPIEIAQHLIESLRDRANARFKTLLDELEAQKKEDKTKLKDLK